MSFVNLISNERNPLINKLNSIFHGCNTEPRNNTKKSKQRVKKNICMLSHMSAKKDYLMKVISS